MFFAEAESEQNNYQARESECGFFITKEDL